MRQLDGKFAATVAWGFKTSLEAKGFEWYTRPFELNIVGVRSSAKKAGAFDDACWVIWYDDAGDAAVTVYDITCDPGPRYLRRPIHRKGCAILCPGQYVGAYMLGKHRGKYMALVQAGGPVRVYRDDDRDGFLDHAPESVMKGWFGINLHHARGEYDFGDKFRGASAGCQVWASKTEFEHFISLCQTHRDRHGKKFTYTLIDEV